MFIYNILHDGDVLRTKKDIKGLLYLQKDRGRCDFWGRGIYECSFL